LNAKPNDAAATRLKADAQRQMDLAEKAKAQEAKYLAAMSAGQSALGRKDYAEALKQAEAALEAKPNDPAAAKLRADAQALRAAATIPKTLPEERPTSSQAAAAPGYDASRLSLMKRASQLIGRKVGTRVSLGSVGKLEDIAVDLSTGRLPLALVSSGSDQSATPVPAATFTMPTAKDPVLGVDKKTFSSATRVAKSNWTKGIDATSLTNAAREFGQQPPGEAFSPAGVSSGANLLGRHLTSQTGEPLGDLEDLMIDLPAGRVVLLVIRPVAGPEPDKRLYALPPASVRINPANGSLVLRASLEHFLAGPHFDKQFWTELIDLAEGAYQHYAPKEGAAKAGADPALPSHAQTVASVSSGPSELQTKKAVLGEIVTAPGLKEAPNDLTITILNGRLILTGRVRDLQQRLVIGEAAERVVGVGKVDNQLKTRSGR